MGNETKFAVKVYPRRPVGDGRVVAWPSTTWLLLSSSRTGWRQPSQPVDRGLVQHDRWEQSEDRRAGRGDGAEDRAIRRVSEDRAAVSEDQDVGQENRGDESVQHLSADHQTDRVPRQKCGRGADNNWRV
jgi:hypothetical protein